VQHATIIFEGGSYTEAADQFTAGITAIADLFPPAKLDHDSVLVEPRPTVVLSANSMVTEVCYYEAAPTH
jgi:hypothetical protein